MLKGSGINMVFTFRLTMMILLVCALAALLSLLVPFLALARGREHLAGSLSFYHCAEFATVARYNPHILNIDSFLVNQVCVRVWRALRAAWTCHSLSALSLSATVHTVHRSV